MPPTLFRTNMALIGLKIEYIMIQFKIRTQCCLYNNGPHPVIYVNVGIKHTCGNLISFRKEGFATKTPLFIEVHVPRQECERSLYIYICIYRYMCVI